MTKERLRILLINSITYLEELGDINIEELEQEIGITEKEYNELFDVEGEYIYG